MYTHLENLCALHVYADHYQICCIFAHAQLTDADEAENGNIASVTLSTGEARDFFGVVLTGFTVELLLLAPLDRETISSFSFTIYAMDDGETQMSGEADVFVSVEVRIH